MELSNNEKQIILDLINEEIYATEIQLASHINKGKDTEGFSRKINQLRTLRENFLRAVKNEKAICTYS